MIRNKRNTMLIGKNGQMHPIQMLLDDHKEVVQLFTRFERTRDVRMKTSLLEAILEELTVHAVLEEEIFYPAVREKIRNKVRVDLAVEDHRAVRFMVSELEAAADFDERTEAKCAVLIDAVRQHIREEESEMFPEARELDLAWETLAREMSSLKKKMLDRLKSQDFASVLIGKEPYL